MSTWASGWRWRRQTCNLKRASGARVSSEQSSVIDPSEKCGGQASRCIEEKSLKYGQTVLELSNGGKPENDHNVESWAGGLLVLRLRHYFRQHFVCHPAELARKQCVREHAQTPYGSSAKVKLGRSRRGR